MFYRSIDHRSMIDGFGKQLTNRPIDRSTCLKSAQ